MDTLLKLGIDPWSMLFYFVNILLLIAVLTFYLYRPILAIIDQRKKSITDSINEAETLKQEFDKRLAELNEEKDNAQKMMKEEMSKFKKHLEDERIKMLADVEAKRMMMMKETQETLDSEKARLMKDAESAMINMMNRIVLNVLQNKVPSDIVRDSVDESWNILKDKLLK